MAGRRPLGELGDREGDETGRDEDQDDAGDREEPAEVDAHAHREEGVADADRDRQARQRRDEQTGDVAARRPDREQEQDGLETLAGDREEGQAGQRGGRSDGQGLIDAAFELALHRGPGGASRRASR